MDPRVLGRHVRTTFTDDPAARMRRQKKGAVRLTGREPFHCTAGLRSGLWPLWVRTGRYSHVRDRSCRKPRRPLPSEVVAYVGVAVSGIKPQAPVKRKRVIQLIDLRAGIGDRRWDVNAG